VTASALALAKAGSWPVTICSVIAAVTRTNRAAAPARTRRRIRLTRRRRVSWSGEADATTLLLKHNQDRPHDPRPASQFPKNFIRPTYEGRCKVVFRDRAGPGKPTLVAINAARDRCSIARRVPRHASNRPWGRTCFHVRTRLQARKVLALHGELEPTNASLEGTRMPRQSSSGCHRSPSSLPSSQPPGADDRGHVASASA
jgi:hypothetical protein